MESGIMKCKNCGQIVDLSKSINGVIECNSCGSIFPVPRKDLSTTALSFLRQGEHDLDTCKFNDAYTAYAKAAEYDNREPEAYWGMALAEFKVQYIKDIDTETGKNRMQPICHEFPEKQFIQNRNYQLALKRATQEQREEYIKKAQEIDYIRSEFLKLKQSGLDYDCFICVKVSRIDSEQVDYSKKNWTEDAYTADAIYDLLKRNDYKPFFSEREIRGRTGADYEAMVLYALYTSETMLVVCRNEEYLQTRWVKNEYTRFKELVNNKEKENTSLTIVFSGTPIERLPGSNGKIQGIDYSRREADFEIVKFVDAHTPIAKVKRDEEKRREQEEKDALRRQLDEQKRQMAEFAQMRAEMEAFRKQLAESKKVETQLSTTQQSSATYHNTVAQSKPTNFQQAKSIATPKLSTPPIKTEIKDGEFKNRTDLKCYIIPSTITRIGKSAFEGCSNLSDITIPNSVISISSDAFKGTAWYDNQPDGLVYAGKVLYKYKGIMPDSSSIILKNDTLGIAEYAFYGCSGLVHISIPESVTNIGYGAFGGTAWYDNQPDGLVYVGKIAYKYKGSLAENTSIVIKAGTKSVANFAFGDNFDTSRSKGLTNIIIPNSVTSIGEGAFYGCSSITSIIIPDSVIRIGRDAFKSCSGLCSITVNQGNPKYHSAGNCLIDTTSKTLVVGCKSSVIPTDGSVTIIGNSAFYGCGLTSITIPYSVTEFSSLALSYCSSLKNINYEGTKKQWKLIYKYKNIWFGSEDWNCNQHDFIIHCIDGNLKESTSIYNKFR